MIQNPSVAGAGSEAWFTVPVMWDRSGASTRVGGGINQYGRAQFDLPNGVFGFLCVPADFYNYQGPCYKAFCFISNYGTSNWIVQANPSIIGLFSVDQISVANNSISFRVGVNSRDATSPLFIYPVMQSPEGIN